MPTLYVWYAANQTCTSGVYFGVVKTPNTRISYCRREGLPTLCVWYAFDQTCISGLHFGRVITQRENNATSTGGFAKPVGVLRARHAMYLWIIFGSSSNSTKENKFISAGKFANPLRVVPFPPDMYLLTILWSSDETKKENNLMSTGRFANPLGVQYAFYKTNTAGLYFGIVTAQTKKGIERRRDVLPTVYVWHAFH